MWSFLLIGLLAATVIVLVGTNLRQRRLIEGLKRAREELQVEEDRVFDFLHGLGEAFSDNLRSSDLHRLIVEGATRITDAHGRLQEVRGAGVIGKEPVLRPGEDFEYTSGVPLPTPSGFMTGTYGMVTEAGEPFDIDIPAFSLDTPQGGRTIN